MPGCLVVLFGDDDAEDLLVVDDADHLAASMTRTGWSEASTAWAAFRTIVSHGMVGPVRSSSGRGSRITHLRVSTCERGTSETKSRT